MRIAALSYPMFTQTQGGLAIQIAETIDALQSLHCDIRLIDPYREKLASFDLIHVFAAGSGNFRIVQFAQAARRPVVMSPLIRPFWTRSLGRRAKFLDRVIDRLTDYRVSTEYRDLRSGLAGSDRLIALGPAEERCIVEAFEIDAARITVVPNGIPQRFFEPDPAPFLQRFGLEPGFVLCVASIDEHKNQLGLARALAGSGRQLVLIGECHEPSRGYLQQILSLPGTRHAGSLPYADPLLASAYAAAGVFALVSNSEVMPLTVLEALAAGTPVVMTRHHGMDTRALRQVLIEVDPASPDSIARAIAQQLTIGPKAGTCTASVRHLTWTSVARSLLGVYEQVLDGRHAPH